MKHNESYRRQLDKVSPVVKQEMDWSCAIIDRIDYIIKRDGITQRELAERIGCNETQITRWTRGFPNFTLSSLAKLSQALGEPLIKVVEKCERSL
ncbi:MAG: helix-turn-helix transcriptional regulator [Bacteroidales bacterium]|nr:helix-turn-helix transcriptional regulator [Bacteroidales bacterium]